MKKITPCLWFDNKAEEAVHFYMSLFPEGEILHINRYPEETPGLAGQVLTIYFRLAGQEFIALNGGPVYKFTEAVSLSVDCSSQEEIDFYWEKFTEEGEESQCGWLKDKYGLSWQIVPSNLGQLLYNHDPDKAQRSMAALLKMKKIVIAGLSDI